MRPDNSKFVSLLLFFSVALFLFGCNMIGGDDDDDDAVHYITSYERMNFWDTNWQPYKLGGKLKIDRARDESGIVEYRLYWGWGPRDEDKVVDVQIDGETVNWGPLCIWSKNSLQNGGTDASADSSNLNDTDKLILTFSRTGADTDQQGSKNCGNVSPEIPEKEAYTSASLNITDPNMGIVIEEQEFQYVEKATHFLLYTKSSSNSELKFSQAFRIKDNIGEYLATMSEDLAYDVAVDGQGNVFVTGATRGDIVNESIKYDALYFVDFKEGDLVYENRSYSDAFLKKHDSAAEIYAYDSINININDSSYDKVPNVESVTEVMLRTTAPIENSSLDLDHTPGYWDRQWGGTGSDAGLSVAVGPRGYIYVTGYTHSNHRTNPNDVDYFLAKYSPSGDRVWQRQEGTEDDDIGNNLIVDKFGNVYVTGVTGGPLAGPHKGRGDVFIFKYDTNGEKIWQRQIGTSLPEAGHALAIDRYDNVTLVGEISVDESADDNADSSDQADVSDSDLSGRDAFIIKTDRYGSILWRREIRTSKLDRAYDVAMDSHGNAYVAGESYENLSQLAYYLEQNMDKEEVYGPYLLKYDPYGNLIWVKHPGTEVFEDAQSRGQARSVAVDSRDNIYVTGTVYNSVMENVKKAIKGSNDSFLLRYDIWGNETWHKHIGTSEMDEGFGLALDSSNNVYIVGATNGYLPYGQTMGRELQKRYNTMSRKDGFLIRPNTKFTKPYLRISRGHFLKYKEVQYPDPYISLGGGISYSIDCNKLATAALAFWSISWAYGLFETLVAINSPFSLVNPTRLPLKIKFLDKLLLGPDIMANLLAREYWNLGRIALDPATYLVTGSVITAGMYMGYCHRGGHF